MTQRDPHLEAFFQSMTSAELAEFDASPSEEKLDEIYLRRVKATNPFAHARLIERRKQMAESAAWGALLRGEPLTKGTSR